MARRRSPYAVARRPSELMRWLPIEQRAPQSGLQQGAGTSAVVSLAFRAPYADARRAVPPKEIGPCAGPGLDRPIGPVCPGHRSVTRGASQQGHAFTQSERASTTLNGQAQLLASAERRSRQSLFRPGGPFGRPDAVVQGEERWRRYTVDANLRPRRRSRSAALARASTSLSACTVISADKPQN